MRACAAAPLRSWRSGERREERGPSRSDTVARVMPLMLRHDAHALAKQYREAEPFPHVVLDALFDDAALEAVLREFPSPEAMQWVRFDNPLEKKLGFFHETSTLSDAVRRFLDAMNSFEMLL